MAQDIDFLPASYHAQRRHKTRSLWRKGIFCAFLLLAVAGAIQQRRSLQELRKERDRLNTQLAKMESHLPPVTELKQAVSQNETAASLVAMLQCRVPPTRLVAAVTTSLPDHVSLNEFQVIPQRISGQHIVISEVMSRPNRGKKTEQKLTPLEEDWKALLQQVREQSLTMTVRGVAPHDMAISEYLAALKGADLFESVQLRYTDLHLHQGYTMRSFAIDLQVRNILSEEWNLARHPKKRVPLLAQPAPDLHR